MKTIPLTQGEVAVVDDRDFYSVSQYKWSLRKIGRKKYAGRYRLMAEGFPKGSFVYLHQFLIPTACKIDHRDGDGLNNQRYNLRSATDRQNSRGFRLKAPGATSRFRGVSWDASRQKWKAQGKTSTGKTLFLGRFEEEEQAAKAYDAHALAVYEVFACPNYREY
jgi:hypothetical protein